MSPSQICPSGFACLNGACCALPTCPSNGENEAIDYGYQTVHAKVTLSMYTSINIF